MHTATCLQIKKQTHRNSHKSFISPPCTDLAELNTLTYYYADSVYSSNTCTVSKGNKGGMQKYLENALHGCNVNVNFFISLIHHLLFTQHEEPVHSLLS